MDTTTTRERDFFLLTYSYFTISIKCQLDLNTFQIYTIYSQLQRLYQPRLSMLNPLAECFTHRQINAYFHKLQYNYWGLSGFQTEDAKSGKDGDFQNRYCDDLRDIQKHCENACFDDDAKDRAEKLQEEYPRFAAVSLLFLSHA